MHILNLDSAVSEIVDACAWCAVNGKYPSPFFFVAGAGVSHPTIPLAGHLENECKAIAHKKGRFAEPLTQDAIDRYSHWLEAAFPHSEQRREYLQKKIHQKPIAPASLRLAHLLSDGQISKLIVTPNFDDFVTRALALFGEPPIVCDHPGTIRRLNPQSMERQILHVHGTYWFYDCCNLKGEIAQRASENDGRGGLTVASFLSNLLWHRSPLVIGYSGWENDVIMTALRSRLVGQILPFNIYWFCYERKNVETLPAWLKTHENVRFVMPDSAGSVSADSAIGLGNDPGQTLDAQAVLGKFIRQLKLEAPLIFRNPQRAFAQQIERDIYPDVENTDDIYHVKSLLAQLNAIPVFTEAVSSPAAGEAARLVTEAVDAVRKADFTTAINICKTIRQEELSSSQKYEVIAVLMNAALDSMDVSDPLRLDAYDLVLKLAGSAEWDATGSDQYVKVVAHASFQKGLVLSRIQRYEDAIAAFDACIAIATGVHEPPECSVLADALFCKGLALSDAGFNERELETYGEFRHRYGASMDPHLRQLLARSLANMGMDLHRMGRSDEALEILGELVSKFGKDDSESVHEPVAKALVHMGLISSEKDDREGALKMYDEVLRRFGHLPVLAVRDPLGRALANKGMLLGQMDRKTEALETYRQMVLLFGDASDELLRPVLARVLNKQGVLFGGQGQHEDAIVAFDKVLKHFESARSPELVNEASLALANKGVALKLVGRDEDAMKCWDAVFERVREFGAEMVGEAAIKTAAQGRPGLIGKSER